MNVVFNLLNYRPRRIGGAETYILRLLEHLTLDQLRSGDELKVLGHMETPLGSRLQEEHLQRLSYTESSITRQRILEAISFYRARRIETFIRGLDPTVVFYPQQSLFPKRTHHPSVMTVVDIQHKLFPERFSWADRFFRRAIYDVSMKSANRLIAISEFTKKTLVEHCGISESKVVTIPLGYDPPEALPDSPAPHEYTSYVYYPASTYPHKNHAELFASLAALHRSGRWNHQLVLTGILTPDWPSLQKQVARLGIEKLVHHEGFVDYTRVNQLYQHADAVLFPSKFEGFGIPVLEANTHGKKIITSDIPAFREIGMPEPFRIDFADPDQLAVAFEQEFPGLTKTHLTWRENALKHWELFREFA